MSLSGGRGGSHDEDACERPCPKRRKRRGVRYRGEGESRADRVREKERKHTAQMDKASMAQCHGQTRAGVQVGPGTDGVRETCTDSNPACEA